MMRRAKKYSLTEVAYIPLGSILTDVCTVYDQTIRMVKSPHRSKELIMCRQIFIYVSILKTGFNHISIANEIGRRDHTIVGHHFKNVTAYIKDKDSEFIKGWRHYLENSLLFSEADFIEVAQSKSKQEDFKTVLQEFVSNHEAGLLPNKFVYEKAIKILNT